jgi:hypothetical protein
MPALNLAEKLSTFSEHWQPRVIGQFNDHDVIVAKIRLRTSYSEHR